MNEQFGQSFDPNQNQIEQKLKEESLETREVLSGLEQEKRDEPMSGENNSEHEISSELGQEPPRRKTGSFIEKIGGIISRREKTHTGKGIKNPEQHLGSRPESNKHDYIDDQLDENALTWNQRTGEIVEDKIEPEVGVELPPKSFGTLFEYLNEYGLRDPNQVEKYGQSKSQLERLQLLSRMSLPDAVECIRQFSPDSRNYTHLSRRLDHYQKLSQGKATKKVWDSQAGEYVRVEIDASDIQPENIRLGIWRETLYSAMIGTPEMGAIKVATNRINAREDKKSDPIDSVVTLHGYYSGVFEGNLGMYPELVELYEKCKRQVHARQELGEDELEHRAVMLMAKRLEDAFDYNGGIDTSGSPYNAGFKEAVAVGQLGHKVMRQMRGMRNKIQETNLQNVERFIGKSGDNRYGREKKRLDNNVKALEDFNQDNRNYDALHWPIKNEDGTKGQVKGKDAAELMTKQKNSEALQRAKLWFDKESEKINRWFEKSKTKIASYDDILEEERTSIYESVQVRYDEQMARLQQEYQEEIARLENRTPEELLEELKHRQEIVDKRFEKRKSLAQKALDLHFHFNHDGGDYGSKPWNFIDWINYAPLGTIKRAHRMINEDIDDKKIIELSLTDIICGARNITPEDIASVHQLVQQAEIDQNARQRLDSMMKVGNIVSHFHHELSIDEVSEIASQNFYGLTPVLELYSLEEAKQFMASGLNLNSVAEARKTTQAHGHDLSPEKIAEIASHNINGLDQALESFSLEDVGTLLNQDVALPTAIAVRNNTKRFNYELSIDQIASIAKNVNDVDDFISALRGLPIAEVEKLFSVGVPFEEFGKVKGALANHNLASDFNSSLAVAQKLAKNDEYGNLEQALQVYSLQEIDQIVTNGATLNNVLGVRRALDSKGVASSLAETIQFARCASEWSPGNNVGQAIDAFGIDNVRKIVSKSCKLDKALEVNNYINNNARYYGQTELTESLRESLKQGGVDVIIAIARAGNMEVAARTLGSGFTVEEITKFPFLISRLLPVKSPEIE